MTTTSWCSALVRGGVCRALRWGAVAGDLGRDRESRRGDSEGCLLIATESIDSPTAAFQGRPESDGNDVIIDRELPKNDIRSLIN
jgi:hypothetical protein